MGSHALLNSAVGQFSLHYVLYIQVDDVALQGLQSRCTQLHHLDLSWTGAGGLITEKELCK